MFNNDLILARSFKNEFETIYKVSDYEKYLKQEDIVKKKSIADLIYHRLHGRYLKVFTFDNSEFTKKHKSGFSIMANCCLLIETLISFQNGWPTTENKSAEAFKLFFTQNENFKIKESDNFYKNIRCGILHQGETYGGWMVVREGKYKEGKKINANEFLKKVDKSLMSHKEKLVKSDWDSEIWNNCRVKMRSIIKNCS